MLYNLRSETEELCLGNYIIIYVILFAGILCYHVIFWRVNLERLFFSLWLSFCTAVIIVSINSACLNSPDKIENCENNKNMNIFHYDELN